MSDKRWVLVVLVAVLFLSGCSGEADPGIYRFEASDCPLSKPAKNLRVQTNKNTLAVYGVKTADVAAHFYHSAPGGVVIKPDGASITYNLEGIFLHSGVGVMVERVYYKFDEDGILPVQIAPKNYTGSREKITFACLDKPGTENIQVVVGSDKLATLIAGLYWSGGTIGIREDGIVVVNRAGLKSQG